MNTIVYCAIVYCTIVSCTMGLSSLSSPAAPVLPSSPCPPQQPLCPCPLYHSLLYHCLLQQCRKCNKIECVLWEP